MKTKVIKLLLAAALTGAAMVGVMPAAPANAAAHPGCCVAPWKYQGYYVGNGTADARNTCDTAGLRGQNNRYWVTYQCYMSDWDIFNLYVVVHW
jgi:hypothetical protein